MRAPRVLKAVMLATVLVVLASAAAAAERLATLRSQLGMTGDPERVSVSGLSSGGFMAVQYHLAHSTNVTGVGVVAGGPYGCAAASRSCSLAFGVQRRLCRAFYVCTAFARETFGLLAPYFGPPGHADSVSIARRLADDGAIDPLTGLAGDRIWLFAGRRDTLVPPAVVADLKAFYTVLLAGTAGEVELEDDLDVTHAMVTDRPEADRCLAAGPPFINDCSFDAAGRMLAFLHGANPLTSSAADSEALFSFDQTAFFNAGDPSVSLAAEGHLYVPQQCRGGARCPVHVAFHGCRQNKAQIDADCAGGRCSALYFFKDAGYNEAAEALGVIALYPQVQPWDGRLATEGNPRGCWDWWGYSGADYLTRRAKQIEAVERMVRCVTAGEGCG
jgi:poly(3-hydroxybutyrate) depolymerase